MKRPGLFEGIVIACILSLAVKPLLYLLDWLVDTRLAVLALITCLGLAYSLYLLVRSQVLTGRITVLTAWAVITALAWMIPLPVTTFILVQLGMIWLLRSLYFYTSFLSALLDLSLVLLGMVIGAWAMTQTHGFPAGVWCFLLVQSLFITIPAGWSANMEEAVPPGQQDRFEYAWRNARLALEKLGAIDKSAIY